MAFYKIHPHPLKDDSIRLLSLLPNEDKTAAVQCKLHNNHSLQESSTRTHLYEALSYVWGDKSDPQTIMINGCPVSVTKNLYAALLHLRDHSFERNIWVDAVCIDQDTA
jgi:hypothetical protein